MQPFHRMSAQRCLGPARYDLCALWTILKKISKSMKVVGGDDPHSDNMINEDGPVVSLFINQTQYFGKGLRAAPDAKLDDGLMDLGMMKSGSRDEVRPMTGRWQIMPGLETLSSQYRRHSRLTRRSPAPGYHAHPKPIHLDVPRSANGASVSVLLVLACLLLLGGLTDIITAFCVLQLDACCSIYLWLRRADAGDFQPDSHG